MEPITIEDIINDLRCSSEILVREPVSYSWAKDIKEASDLLEHLITCSSKV